MSITAVARRRAERAAKIADGSAWAATLGERLPGLQGVVVVVGSYARGDFNRWSDGDVLVVADGLSEQWLARCDVVAPKPPGVEAIVWTPGELAERRSGHDRVAVEVYQAGVAVLGALPPVRSGDGDHVGH